MSKKITWGGIRKFVYKAIHEVMNMHLEYPPPAGHGINLKTGKPKKRTK